MTFNLPHDRMTRGNHREARGHRHVGGLLGARPEARHYGADVALIAIAAVGAAASAYGTYAASEAASEAHTYNKKIAENQAVYAQQQADIAAQTEQEKNRHILAAQRAAYGSSGVTDEGSPLMVMADTARQMERDQYLIKYGGDVSASGYRAQAGLQGLYARQSQQQGQVGAGVSLLSSASNIGGKYYYGRYGGSGSRD
jgi:hypothetical protein